MPTRVTITGTGTPIIRPHLAGGGVLVRYEGPGQDRPIALQFDAGRATVMRLAGAGQSLTGLDALFVTHHHSDHVVGVTDLVMSRWLDDTDRSGQAQLPVHAPAGDAARLLAGLLNPWHDELSMRQTHTHRPDIPSMDVRPIAASKSASVDVASFPGPVTVTARAVDHEPVAGAVGYRVDTPDGSVVISGDTAICHQIEEMASGADVLVHEAMRMDRLAGLLSAPDEIAAYHSGTVEIGALAARAEVGHVVLTHLIPPPESDADFEAFEDDVRRGGYDGPVTVARDLDTVSIG